MFQPRFRRGKPSPASSELRTACSSTMPRFDIEGRPAPFGWKALLRMAEKGGGWPLWGPCLNIVRICAFNVFCLLFSFTLKSLIVGQVKSMKVQLPAPEPTPGRKDVSLSSGSYTYTDEESEGQPQRTWQMVGLDECHDGPP